MAGSGDGGSKRRPTGTGKGNRWSAPSGMGATRSSRTPGYPRPNPPSNSPRSSGRGPEHRANGASPGRNNSLTPSSDAHRTGRQGGGGRKHPIRVVAIGGGTGLSLLLRGLSGLGRRVDITAVVAVSDDGGSSGRLRAVMPLPAVGDARACLAALSPPDSGWAEFLEHRYRGGDGLRGHAAGNLLLAAACEREGGLEAALEFMARLIGIRGRVLPSSDALPELVAHLRDGRVIRGQSLLSAVDGPIERVELLPRLVPPADGVIDAINQADLVVMGPGSLFSSVIAAALPAGISRALCDLDVPRIFVQNLTVQRGETDGMDALEHVCAVREHLGLRSVSTVLAHHWTGRPPEQGLVTDPRLVRELGLSVVTTRLVSGDGRGRLHDPRRLANAIWRIAAEAGGRPDLRLVVD